MTIKVKLHQQCCAVVMDRMANIRQAIISAQTSANEETKSSAGDKYETGRAMMQLEIEKLSAQLAEVIKLKHILDQIAPEKPATTVLLGSLVKTSGGTYYISISAGTIVVDGSTYFCVSQSSPVAQAIRNKKVGDQVAFNNKLITIDDIS